MHRSQIRRLEGHKRLKPYILHRFAPGMYAIDRSKRDEIERVLAESGFSPNRETRTYPGTPEAVEARAQLHKALFEAREAVQDPMGRDAELIDPRNLQPVPGTRLEESGEAEPDMPPEVDANTARQIIDKALSKDQLLQMVYLAKTGQRIACEIRHPSAPDPVAAARDVIGRRAVDAALVPIANRRKKILVADMDSTMIEQECIDELADAVGIKDQVAEITSRAMNGELDFEQAQHTDDIGLAFGTTRDASPADGWPPRRT